MYTAPGVDLPFTGDDAITLQTKDIVISTDGDDSTCVVENPGDEGHSGTCVYAQIQILEPNRGAMEIDDSAIAYTGAGRSGDNTFNIGGTLADVQGALASLVYVPPDDEFETTDQATVTLRIQLQNASPQAETTYIDVDIRVEGDNAPPDLTAPGDDPYEVEVGETFSILESAGTEVFTVTDEDAQQGDSNPPDYLLGVAWLDCGTMTFPVGSGYASYEGTPEELLEALDLDPALIPGQIASNLVLGTGWDDVTAVAWLATIDTDNDDADDNFNNVMRWIDFHAPATAGTCTLTILVTDLGNNGMPLIGEVPNFGIDVDSVVFDVVDPNAPGTTVPPEPTEPTDTTEVTDTTVPSDTTEATTPPSDTTGTTEPPGDTTETTTERTVPPRDTTETTTETTDPTRTARPDGHDRADARRRRRRCRRGTRRRRPRRRCRPRAPIPPTPARPRRPTIPATRRRRHRAPRPPPRRPRPPRQPRRRPRRRRPPPRRRRPCAVCATTTTAAPTTATLAPTTQPATTRSGDHHDRRPRTTTSTTTSTTVPPTLPPTLPETTTTVPVIDTTTSSTIVVGIPTTTATPVRTTTATTPPTASSTIRRRGSPTTIAVRPSGWRGPGVGPRSGPHRRVADERADRVERRDDDVDQQHVVHHHQHDHDHDDDDNDDGAVRPQQRRGPDPAGDRGVGHRLDHRHRGGPHRGRAGARGHEAAPPV